MQYYTKKVNNIKLSDLKLKQIVYYARIIPNVSLFEILELKVRTIGDTYFVGNSKHEKKAILISEKSMCDVFEDRQDCLKVVKDAEKEYKKTHKTEEMEVYYDE